MTEMQLIAQSLMSKNYNVTHLFDRKVTIKLYKSNDKKRFKTVKIILKL